MFEQIICQKYTGLESGSIYYIEFFKCFYKIDRSYEWNGETRYEITVYGTKKQIDALDEKLWG